MAPSPPSFANRVWSVELSDIGGLLTRLGIRTSWMGGKCGIKATSPTPGTGNALSMSNRNPVSDAALSLAGEVGDNSSERVHTAFAVGGLGVLGR